MKAAKREAQFMAVYDAHADAIFRYCYFRVFNRERAHELMQDAFMKTWEQMTRGKEIDNIRAFVYRVANNLIIDESRKKREASLEAMQEESGFDPGVAQHESMAASVDANLLLEVAKQLDDAHREVLIMRYVNNLAPREIAEILDESTNVISVRIHRAVKEMKKRLSQ